MWMWYAVSLQFITLRERLFTNVARIRFFLCVNQPVRRCFITLSFWEKSLSQTSVCVPWCFVLPLIWTNNLSQTLQVYGFSPIYVRWCIVRPLIWANDFSHTAHGYDFSSTRVLQLKPRRALVLFTVIRAAMNVVTRILQGYDAKGLITQNMLTV